MKAEINGTFVRIIRDENDNPIVERDILRPANNAQEFNSWRKDYPIAFPNDKNKAKIAYEKVISIGDFDKAAAWLDKQ